MNRGRRSRSRSLALRREHDALGQRPSRSDRARPGARDTARSRRRATIGWPSASTASVLTWTNRGTLGALHERRAARCVPSTLTLRMKSASVPCSFAIAAAWNTTSQSRIAAGERLAGCRDRRSRRLGTERYDLGGGGVAARERDDLDARARDSAWINAPPTKPEPPVTNARFMTRNLLGSRRRERR